MAKTPFSDLGSTDILSGHISGLQHSVNKIEEVLNMKTSSIAGHPLTAVVDQDDPAMRYKIYEGTIRNWLSTPTPVIYRDGIAVPGTEYTAFPAYGVVVFNTQQAAAAAITADVSYVANQSTVVDSIGDILPILHVSGQFRSNNLGAAAFLIAAASVDTATIVCHPFIVPETTTYDMIAARAVAAGLAGSLARIGLYADNGSMYPGALLFDSGDLNISTAGVKSAALNLTLDRGIYWLASIVNDDNPGWMYHDWAAMLQLGVDGTLTGSPAVGWKVAQAFGAFPASFPVGALGKYGGEATRNPAVFLRRA